MYSVQQGKGGLPIFVGSATQRGRGFGSLLGGLLKNAIIPLARTGIRQLAPVARQVGRQVLRVGKKQAVRALKDVVRGRNVRDAVMNRMIEPLVRQERQPRQRQPARRRTTQPVQRRTQKRKQPTQRRNAKARRLNNILA